MPPPPKKDASLSLRITNRTKTRMQAAADKRKRSLNWLAEHIFEQWLTRHEPR